MQIKARDGGGQRRGRKEGRGLTWFSALRSPRGGRDGGSEGGAMLGRVPLGRRSSTVGRSTALRGEI